MTIRHAELNVEKQEFTTELYGAFSIKTGLLVSNRKNPEKRRKERGDAEHQN